MPRRTRTTTSELGDSEDLVAPAIKRQRNSHQTASPDDLSSPSNSEDAFPSSSNSSSLPGPTPRRNRPQYGFHRTLQESALSLAHSYSVNSSYLSDSIRRRCHDHERLEKVYRAQNQTIVDSLVHVNDVLARATVIERACQQLSVESSQISNDFNQLMQNFSQLNRAVCDGDADWLPCTAEELFNGELCEGIFDSLEFDPSVDYGASFDVLMSGLEESSSTYTLGTGWRIGFAALFPPELDDAMPPFRGEGDETKSLRSELLKILKMVALAQVKKVFQSHQLLREISEISEGMRRESNANREALRETMDEINEVRADLKVLKKQLPGTEEKLQMYVLDLIVLSKGP